MPSTEQIYNDLLEALDVVDIAIADVKEHAESRHIPAAKLRDVNGQHILAKLIATKVQIYSTMVGLRAHGS